MHRRTILTSLSGIALSQLLAGDSRASSRQSSGKGQAHFPAKAKRVLQIFCPGAASHLDLWDYTPDLIKHHGNPLP